MHGYTHHGCAYCDAEFGVDEYDTTIEQIDYNPATRTLLELEATGMDGFMVSRIPDNGFCPGSCVTYGSDQSAAVDSYLRWLWDRRTNTTGGAL